MVEGRGAGKRLSRRGAHSDQGSGRAVFFDNEVKVGPPADAAALGSQFRTQDP